MPLPTKRPEPFQLSVAADGFSLLVRCTRFGASFPSGLLRLTAIGRVEANDCRNGARVNRRGGCGERPPLKYGDRFLPDEGRPMAIEYAVMLALIVAVCLATIDFLDEAARTSFIDSTDAIKNAVGGGS